MQSEDDAAGTAKQPAPWAESAHILFEERPWVKPFTKYYLWIILIGYPAVIALAHSLHFSFLPKWLALWAPLTHFLSAIFPVFVNTGRAFANKGFGGRIGLVHHVLSFEWIASVVIIIALIVTIVTLPATAWKRYTSSVPAHRIIIGLLLSLVSFVALTFWAVIGFGFLDEGFLFDWHRSDLSIPTIGAFFGSAIIAAVMACASGGALIAAVLQRFLAGRGRSG
jgi:hypothetical protein